MAKQKLTNQQTIIRALILLFSIGLVCWFFPHNEAFRYEYEIGKPWRYGRLTAPYDFPIYLSDSAVMQMEDSLHAQIVPRFQVDASVPEKVHQQLLGHPDRLSSEARQHLQTLIGQIFAGGILTGEDKQQLERYNTAQVILESGPNVLTVSASRLLSERQAYELIHNDSLFAREYASLPLQRYLSSNLRPDTLAMNLEYARLRQQVSSTSGVVLAESRIIDQGEIVTRHTYNVLESYRREQQERMRLTGDETLMWVGRIPLVALLLGSILLFFVLFRPWIHVEEHKVMVVVGAIAVMFVLSSLANRIAVGAVYLVPIGIVTILLSTFHGSRAAFHCHIIMVLLCSFVAPSHFEYLFIQSIIGMIIVYSLKDGLQERAQLMHVSLFSAIGYPGIYALYTLATEGTLINLSLPIVGMMLINAILLLLSYLIIYAMEKLFGFVSGISLIELCNLGKGILLRLSKEAPGTFQHSIQLSNLAASAAKEVGANYALVRTGALYHDIGKLWAPQMYTENQLEGNPHDKLSIEESVEIIKRHVTEGIEIAQKAKLPNDLIDFIRTHHGCSQVKHFYIKWCNEHPDQEPDAKFFSYAGPDPVTKEQAILMMADGVEAASRTMKEYTHASITQLVNNIVGGLVTSGRLNNAKLTLHEIELCKESFVRDIETINHARITYPELNKKGGPSQPSQSEGD